MGDRDTNRRWADDNTVRRHNDDEWAHGEALKPVWAEVRNMQKFFWMVTGGLTVLSILAVSGFLIAVGHNLHWW